MASKRRKRAIGCDPGTANYGIGAVELRANGSLRILGSALCSHPIKDAVFPRYTASRIAYEEVMGGYTAFYRPKHYILERFQTRGIKGKTIELVSMMLALTERDGDNHGYDTAFVVASQWKNAFNRRFALEKGDKPLVRLYAAGKAHKVAPHRIDAVLLAIYKLGGNSFESFSKSDIKLSRIARPLKRRSAPCTTTSRIQK